MEFHLKLVYLGIWLLILLSPLQCHKKAKNCQKPIDLAFLVDLSGSMEINQREFVSQVAKYIADKLHKKNNKNKVGVVSFHSNANISLKFTPIKDLSKIFKALELHKKGYEVNASTNLDYGIEKVCELFDKYSRKDAMKAVITISDGHVTLRGKKDIKSLLSKPVEKLKSKGIRSYVIGVGEYTKRTAEIVASAPDHVFQSDMDSLVSSLEHASDDGCPDFDSPTQQSPLLPTTQSPTTKSKSQNPVKCAINFKDLGCFKDTGKSPRPLPELIMTDRDKSHSSYSRIAINWKKWDTYMPDLICRCAKKAQKKNRKIFGLQFYGECWSSPNLDTYNKHGDADNENSCVSFGYKPCLKNKACVGIAKNNFVYRISE